MFLAILCIGVIIYLVFMVLRANFGRQSWAQSCHSTSDPAFPSDDYNLHPLRVTLIHAAFPFFTMIVWKTYHQMYVDPYQHLFMDALMQGTLFSLFMVGIPALIMLVIGWMQPLQIAIVFSAAFWFIVFGRCLGCGCVQGCEL